MNCIRIMSLHIAQPKDIWPYKTCIIYSWQVYRDSPSIIETLNLYKSSIDTKLPLGNGAFVY